MELVNLKVACGRICPESSFISHTSNFQGPIAMQNKAQTFPKPILLDADIYLVCSYELGTISVFPNAFISAG